jgi:hypothetical protein
VDAIDILGALLGRKGKATGAGSKIDTGTLGAGKAKPADDPFETKFDSRPMTVEESAKSLEDLLNVATDHHTSRRTSAPKPAPKPQATPKPAPVALPYRIVFTYRAV